MARNRSYRRARPAHLLAGLVLMSSVGLPALHTPQAIAGASAGAAPITAHGDFNKDGFDDLAVGVPLEDITFANQGAVNIIYGSPSGLNPAGVPSQLLVKNDSVEGPGAQDGFGLALAVGDFNGDRYGDLAVGANGDDVGDPGEAENEGSVTVFYGSANGLVPGTSQYLVAATPGEGDQFGFNLAAGDFNGDKRDELAVSVLNADVGTQANAGAVVVYQGTAAGLDKTKVALLHEDQPGTESTATSGDRFGIALAAGDVNRDGRADLAVGVPGKKVGSAMGAGAVHLFFGCASSPTCNLLDTVNDQFLHEDSGGVKGTAKANDAFGDTLAMADFGRGAALDLAVGMSWKAVNGVKNAGRVGVFYGTTKGLTTQGEQVFHMDHAGMPAGGPLPGDAFGSILAAGNLGRGPQADLAIGMTYRTVGSLTKAGAVVVLYGTPDGLKAAGSQMLTQDSAGLAEKTVAMDGFGKTMLIADFGRTGEADLVVAARGAASPVPLAGYLTVFYGSAQGVGIAGSTQLISQDTPGVPDTAEPDDLFGGAYGQPGLAG